MWKNPCSRDVQVDTATTYPVLRLGNLLPKPPAGHSMDSRLGNRHHPLAAQAPLHQSPPRRRRSSAVERQLPKLQRLPVFKAVIYSTVDTRAWEQIAKEHQVVRVVVVLMTGQ